MYVYCVLFLPFFCIPDTSSYDLTVTLSFHLLCLSSVIYHVTSMSIPYVPSHLVADVLRSDTSRFALALFPSLLSVATSSNKIIRSYAQVRSSPTPSLSLLPRTLTDKLPYFLLSFIDDLYLLYSVYLYHICIYRKH